MSEMSSRGDEASDEASENIVERVYEVEFKVGLDRHDSGKILFSWHPEGNFIASAGKNSE